MDSSLLVLRANGQAINAFTLFITSIRCSAPLRNMNNAEFQDKYILFLYILPPLLYNCPILYTHLSNGGIANASGLL